ncbi:MAG TPA: caspase family protein [Kribbellaceae bacterium]|nr:caspase family protein [Kribbellaceae bacterium]
MAENITRLVLRVEDEQGDQEGLAELIDGLRQELLDLDVDSVERLSAGEAPPGSRAFDVAALGTLVVTLAGSDVLAAVVSAVAMWLTRRRNQVVKIDVDGDVLELSGLPSQERQRLTEEWFRRRAADGSALTGTRSALIIASRGYQDPGLGQLRSPAHDAEALARVLGDPMIGGFDVTTLLDAPSYEIGEAVEEFFADRSPDDLLLMHFSCHGVKDEGGELYFATSNTKLRRLGATAVAADFVNRRMSRSRSRRIVLLLDCCYAGAFERGMTARAGTTVNIEEQFGGRGRAVITASSSMEYAFEGDRLADAHELAPSVFTSALVEGLDTGEADRDQDGQVSLDELYDYVYDKVRVVTPNQTPGKWTFGVQGDIYVARRARPVTTPVPLPSELQQAIDHPIAGIRVGAIQELARLMRSQHAGLALAARLALEQLAEDDSRAVIAAASEALAAGPKQQSSPPPPPVHTPEQEAAPQTVATTRREPPVHRAQVPPQPTPAEPIRRPSTEMTPRHHPGRTTPTTRSGTRWWPGTIRGRVIVATLAAAALLVGGVATWRVLDQAAHSTTIPASFDGQWQGTATTTRDSGAVFTATLGKDLHLGRLASGASSCYNGVLTVADATDSRLTMRFAPGNQTCNPWTVVFTHLSGGDLKMAVDPDSSVNNYEQEFEVRMARQG